MPSSLTYKLFFLCIFRLSKTQLNEIGRQNEDSAERYDADGDLSIPEEAKWKPIDVGPRYSMSEVDRERLKLPPKYEDERSLCYCNYSPRYCGFDNFTCLKHIEAACYHFTEEVYNENTRRMETQHLFGCAPVTRGSGGSYFTCKAYLVAHMTPKSIACCYEGAYCNYNLTVPPYANVSPEGVIVDTLFYQRLSRTSVLFVILAATIFTVTAFFIFTFFFKRHLPWIKPKLKNQPLVAEEAKDSEKSPMLIIDMSSGSGSGCASLNQRTVAQSIQILSVIGKGRYGEVKKALYRGDRFVAVKTFYTTEEDSWKNEKEIYQTQMLNHENILQFVAADIGSEDSITRMLLITDYHEFGSLYEYLQKTEGLSFSEGLQLALSAVCGLEHLHSALRGTGTPQKPAIAHRDVKSKNIIVKRPGVCCIADFGLALSEDVAKTKPNINIQVGTKRYMAPEVLNKTLNVRNFHHFKMADIYSFSLVLWEILRRIEANSSLSHVSQSDSGIGSSGSGNTKGSPIIQQNKKNRSVPLRVNHPYKHDDSTSATTRPPVQPFDGLIGLDPSFDQMQELVCTKKERPALEDSWKKDPFLKDVCDLMVECWSEVIDCRHTALRIKRALSETLRKYEDTTALQMVDQTDLLPPS